MLIWQQEQSLVIGKVRVVIDVLADTVQSR